MIQCSWWSLQGDPDLRTRQDADAPMKVDLTALFLPRQEPLSSTECGELSAQFNEDLESMG